MQEDDARGRMSTLRDDEALRAEAHLVRLDELGAERGVRPVLKRAKVSGLFGLGAAAADLFAGLAELGLLRLGGSRARRDVGIAHECRRVCVRVCE